MNKQMNDNLHLMSNKYKINILDLFGKYVLFKVQGYSRQRRCSVFNLKEYNFPEFNI